MAEKIILSYLLINFIVVISTALFSMAHALDGSNIRFMWALVASAGGISWLLIQKYKPALAARPSSPHSEARRGFGMDEIGLTLGIFCICLVLLVKVVFSAPFANDVLIYHLPRVMHWIQDKTVAPYPTHILRQLFNPPLAAFVQLHLYLLSGGDRLVNVPQYISMLLSLAGVWLIGSQLGLARRENLLAVFLAAFLPAGILIAPTGLTDYSVSLWVIGFVFYALKYLKNNLTPDLVFAWVFLWMIGLTKIHPLLTVGAFIFVLLIKTFRHKSTALAATALILTLFMVWSLNTAFFHFTASGYVFSPLVQISFVHPNWGLLENIFRHLMTQSTISKTDEDTPANPLHTLLLISFLIYFLFNRHKLNPLAQKYAILLSIGLLLSFIVLRANIWTGRFHLPAYLLFCPLMALLMARTRFLLLPAAMFIFICGIYMALFFSKKPLLGKNGVMLVPRYKQILTYDKPSSLFLKAAQDIPPTGCSEIGLIYKNNIYQREYIIWLALKERLNGFRLEHVNVDNASGSWDYPLGAFKPCAVIQATTKNFTDTIQVKNTTLKLYKQYNRFVGLYLPDKKNL